MKCPHCSQTTRQKKAGVTNAGSQRYQCMYCQRKYTPDPKLKVYPLELRQQAVQMFVDGMNLRRNARHLNVNHHSVANWVKQHAEYLPIPPVPEEVDTAELDEVFSFIEDNKSPSTF